MSEPLCSFGPDGTIIALSYDGGRRWVQTPQGDGKKAAPVLRQYTRRVAALAPIEVFTPSWRRRVQTSFSPLADAGILAGWGPEAELLALEPDAVDGVLLPFQTLVTEVADPAGLITAMKAKNAKIFLDLDAQTISDRSQLDLMVELTKLADSVLVPNDLVAASLRKFNARAFAVPPALQEELWRGASRPKHEGPLRIAIQPTADKFVRESVEWAAQKYANQVEIVNDLWEERDPIDEPAFYREIDILVVGGPQNRMHQTNACLLGAMMAGCCIVASGLYNRTLAHNHSGMLVAQKGPSPWRQALTRVITDGRLRLKLQKGARERARHFTARTQLSRLSLPYRVVIPETPAQERKKK